MPERPGVLVTGIGMVSPLGPRPAFWDGVRRGASGIVPLDAFDPGPKPPRLAARVSGWQPKDHIRAASLRRMDRCSQMVVSACRMALEDAALALDPVDAEDAGVVLGMAYGNIVETEEFLRGLLAKGPGLANPFTFPNTVLNAATGYVAMELGLRGPNLTACRGEASGEAALALAYDTIASGQADVLLAGGADEISPVLFHVYKDAGVLSPSERRLGAVGHGAGPPAASGGRADDREWSSPFDRRRNGFVLGEGAAMLVLETAERARARGAPVYAELVGYASGSTPATAHGWPRPDPASALATAHQLSAIGWRTPGTRDGEPVPGRRAGVGAIAGAADMDLVVSCANSSVHLDAFEAAQLAALLGEAAPHTLVTSVKGAIGDFGGAGAFSAAAAVLALRTGDLPRLGTLREADPLCTVPLATPATAAPAHGFGAALVTGMARGGAGVTLLFRGA